MKIKEIEKGATGITEVLILAIQEKTNKNNMPFLDIEISDGDVKVFAKKWNVNAESFQYSIGQVVLMTLKADQYNDNISYIITDITESSTEPEQFIYSAPIKSIDMYNFLYKTAGRCGVYSNTVRKIMEDNKEKLVSWAAGKSIHHNLYGGLLYHTYRMTKTAAYITNVYNKEPAMLKNCRNINTELLVAGTILHDIGKLWELETDQFGAANYTIQGSLMGHAFIGAEVAGKYAREDNVAEEDIMLLQHLILSHHGKYEYRAPVLPAIPEAMILHEIDMIDSRMYQYESVQEEINPGEMSPMIQGLEQIVYRPSWRK